MSSNTTRTPEPDRRAHLLKRLTDEGLRVRQSGDVTRADCPIWPRKHRGGFAMTSSLAGCGECGDIAVVYLDASPEEREAIKKATKPKPPVRRETPEQETREPEKLADIVTIYPRPVEQGPTWEELRSGLDPFYLQERRPPEPLPPEILAEYEAAAAEYDDDKAPLAPVKEEDPEAFFDAPLRTVSDLRRLPRTGWMVDGLIPYGQGGPGRLVTLAGESGGGKSFLALDLALTIATGRGTWMGRDARAGLPAPVLYLALEDPYELEERIDAWVTRHGGRDPEGWFRWEAPPDEIDLTTWSGAEQIIRYIKKAHAQLVVIDSLSVALGDANEDDASSMRPVARSLRRMKLKTQATILATQHTGWGASRERGTTEIRHDADATLFVRPTKSEIRLVCLKMRSAPKFEPISYKLSSVGESAVVEVREEESRETEPGLREKILAALLNEPDLSKSRLYTAVGGNKEEFEKGLDSLVGSGEVEQTKGRRGALLHRVPA